jgi:hypothetical protein
VLQQLLRYVPCHVANGLIRGLATLGKICDESVPAIVPAASYPSLFLHLGPGQAARVGGISERTLYRWVQEPDFDGAYRATRRAAFSQSAARLQQMSSPAVTTLGKIMVDASAPAASRVRAADSVLNHAAKAIEIEDIEARVSELERLAEQNK